MTENSPFGLRNAAHLTLSPGAANSVISHNGKTQVSSRNVAFDEDLSVRLKYHGTANYQDRTVLLHCKMYTETSAGSTVLKVVLTDSEDAFFYYSLSVTEADYHILKDANCLNVDFHSFPNSFVDLLHDTQVVDTNLAATLQFQAGSDATFNVIESRQFREVCILSMQFRKGNDEAVKEHLAAKMKEYSNDSRTLRSQLQQSEDSNISLRRELEHLKQQLSSTEQKMTTQQSTVAGSHQHEIACLKEEHMRRMEEQRLSFQAKLDQEQQLFEREKTTREHVEKQLDAKSKSHDKLQSNNEDLRSKLASVTDQYETAHKEELRIRDDYRTLEKEKYALESNVARLEVLEKEGKEKLGNDRETLQQLRDEKDRIVTSAQKEKATYEDRMNYLEKEKLTLRDTIEELVTEQKKQNSIIEKLTGQKQQLLDKIQKYKTVNEKQEERVKKHEATEAENQREITKLNLELTNKNDDINSKKAEIDKLEREAETNREQLKRNEESIQFLNKALNEKQLEVKPLGATTAQFGVGTFKPTSNYSASVGTGTIGATTPGPTAYNPATLGTSLPPTAGLPATTGLGGYEHRPYSSGLIGGGVPYAPITGGGAPYDLSGLSSVGQEALSGKFSEREVE